MLNLKPPESSSVCDFAAERSKKPRDKVVINRMNGAWEVKGDERVVPVRGVVDQFVRWFLAGTFWPRTDENDWCRHIFRESNKAADTHANL